MTLREHLRRFTEQFATQAEASKRLKISAAALNNYLTGRANPGEKVRARLVAAGYVFSEPDAPEKSDRVTEAQILYIPVTDDYYNTKAELGKDGLLKITIQTLKPMA